MRCVASTPTASSSTPTPPIETGFAATSHRSIPGKRWRRSMSSFPAEACARDSAPCWRSFRRSPAAVRSLWPSACRGSAGLERRHTPCSRVTDRDEEEDEKEDEEIRMPCGKASRAPVDGKGRGEQSEAVRKRRKHGCRRGGGMPQEDGQPCEGPQAHRRAEMGTVQANSLSCSRSFDRATMRFALRRPVEQTGGGTSRAESSRATKSSRAPEAKRSDQQASARLEARFIPAASRSS